MAITYEDFIKSVEEDNLAFVNDMHALFLSNGCKLEIKEAKQGHVGHISHYWIHYRKT